MNILFTFFTLRHIWGLLVLLAHFAMMVVFFYVRFIDNVTHLPEYGSQDLLTFSTEYVICGAGIGYLVYLFIKTSNYAEKELRLKNERLNNHFDVIYKQNKQKETMLKEIHHRVKNNLQIIVSLLRLQAYSKESNGELKEFNDAINRINAMSLIHEKLYQSDMLTDFDLHKYLTSLGENIIEGYGSQEIEVKIEVSATNLSSKTIVPLALLFNELLTNSIKHAFSEQESAKIEVKVEESIDSQFKVSYCDNGKWKESEIESFGLNLIETMTEQLEGTYNREKRIDGTAYEFELNNLS
jgi:two-component sensor histidine kinase